MVQTASNVLTEVFKQWHKEPYRWMKERDIQAEFGGRLTQIFELQGLGIITGDHKWVAPGFSKRQSWSRVSYEPYVYYEYEPGESSYCYPDIVIWDDLKPGEIIPEHQLWPILWACELKYGSSNEGAWDVEKLHLLIDQQKIKFGCAIRMHYSEADCGDEIIWKDTPNNRYLWSCDVNVPELSKPS